MTPHLLKAADDGSGWKPVPAPAPKSQVTLKPETIQAIRDGLQKDGLMVSADARTPEPTYGTSSSSSMP